MKRNAFSLLFISILACSYINAQTVSKEFDKLVFLFIDEKYEKCAKMGLKYTEDDELRRDPIPYLYVSMSFFEIAKIESFADDYPKAFKDALKYAYKYRKKDKNDLYVEKYEGFLTALKDSANKLGQYYIKQEEFRKAASTYKYASRFAPEDPLMQVLQGLAEIKARNIGEGERNLSLGMERIDDNYYPDKDLLYVMAGTMEEYAAYMDSKGDYAGKRKGEQLAEKFKKFSPEEVEKRRLAEAEKNKPKREVKSFETDQQTVENQKTQIMNSSSGADKAKSELEKIEEEQRKKGEPKRETRTFSSDDEDDDDWDDDDE